MVSQIEEKKNQNQYMYLANCHARHEVCGSLSLEHWIYFYSFKPSTFLICKHSRGACGTYLNTMPGANRFQNGMDVSTWKFKCSIATSQYMEARALQSIPLAFRCFMKIFYYFFSTQSPLCNTFRKFKRCIHWEGITLKMYCVTQTLSEVAELLQLLQWRERAKKQSCAHTHVKC